MERKRWDRKGAERNGFLQGEKVDFERNGQEWKGEDWRGKERRGKVLQMSSIDFYLNSKNFPNADDRKRNFEMIVSALRLQSDIKIQDQTDATIAMLALKWLN